MDAIKKKMQAMKLEKDTAQDKADTCEMQAREANLRADKVKNSIKKNEIHVVKGSI
jgi:tropomyosin 1